MSLKKIARNKHGDDVLKLFEGLGHRVTSDDWEVFALQAQYERLKRGEKDGCKLTTYALLKPSIFEGFKRTIVASACMQDTMLFRLFTARGERDWVEGWDPVFPAPADEALDNAVRVKVENEGWQHDTS